MRIRRLAPALCALALAAPATAAAEDPPYLGWAELLPSLASGFTPSTFDDCADGDPACVGRTLTEMRRRFEALGCDHNAVFALTYLRVTEVYERAAARGFFEEPRFLAHEDAVFARLYFDPYDAWAAGRRSRVPAAWRVAFDAGRDRAVSGLGNILLGINAHVNRDMPFMLAGLGLVKPDGSSRKRDHDRLNRLLNAVYDDVIGEVTRRFDPTTDDYSIPGTTLDDAAIFQVLPLWRELAWRHAELLVRARTPAARRLVAGQIESYALAQAQLIRTGAALQRGPSSRARDRWCAQRRRG